MRLLDTNSFAIPHLHCEPAKLTQLSTLRPHTFALALFSRASAQSTTRSLHSPRHMVVTTATRFAATGQPPSRWRPQRSSSALRRCDHTAGCGNAPLHYLHPHCIVPRHDLGSSPRHVVCPSGLLPALHGLRFLAGVMALASPALTSTALVDCCSLLRCSVIGAFSSC